ncbi:RagB/SusD family nutrient uptake outer membrane protein [Sunxiuqinia elliptica]|uniref:Starch-binding associating with outer membrane n=1 Tax=Sunxiuqinia elliptica TaxID=655355 RepID=A0A1I2G938_9BACT|nr:RagB/SusD family nutrient uptake outer membrane protein [Sunxiuqinia elliptica]SFF13151.1 Starch-binding associating with outer membrane [Sunxiuqinia elliptica]
MKKITDIILFGLLSLLFVNCSDDFLDKSPKSLISEVDVFKDPNLVDALLADLYSRTDFQYQGGSNHNLGAWWQIGGEARAFGPWQDPWQITYNLPDENGSRKYDYWVYGNIRAYNDFIQKIESNEILDPEIIKIKSAEAKFLRAWCYFEMVRRFGGVPLILAPQDKDVDDLFVARNSEKDIYDYLDTELEVIAEALPEETEAGRVNKYAAYTFKSRVMLYAASVGEFGGSVQLDGLLGMNSAEADEYWQKAYNAAQSVILSGKYALYNKNSDPVQNYINLFLDESENPEPILSVLFDGAAGKGHMYDNIGMPMGFASWNSNYNPYLEMVEYFDFVDGRSGMIDRAEFNGENHWDIHDLFGKRDPRFRASVFYPESQFQGQTVWMHQKSVGTRPEDSEVPTAGPNRNWQRTGFITRKRIDENHVNPIAGYSSTDYHVFRYAEVLLNKAEAAFYLNKSGEALALVNEVRARAGMFPLTEITEELIRKERQVELVFEDQRFWDLRRWRTAYDELNRVYKGLVFTYDFDATDGENYIITVKNADGSDPHIFEERFYYFPFGLGRISDNPNLVENPGY